MPRAKDKKVLLHICCAPCATYVHHWFTENSWDVTGYWFNPNIQPYREYDRRLLTLKLYAVMANLPVIYRDEYDLERFFKATLGKGEKRCFACYLLRFSEAAALAKKEGYPSFSTTLLISPFQKHEWVKEAAELAGKEMGVKFFYKDFRKEWPEAVRLSKQMNLYRQPYCGCIFSEDERFRGKI